MDNEKEVATQTDKKPASAGRITSVTMEAPKVAAVVPTEQQAAAPADENKNGQAAAQQQVADQHVPEFTEEQKKAFFKTLGIEYTGDDSIAQVKEKLNYQPPAADPTDEQKKAAEAALEKEMLDIFIAGGGTPENFVAIKKIANADVKELSLEQTIEEYIEAGFTRDEATEILAERYYQKEVDALVQEDDETDEEFASRKAKVEAKVQKKKDYFSKKLEGKAATPKTQAEQLLNNLKQVIADKKLQQQREIEHAANATKYLATMPRNLTFELGKLDGKDLAPVQHNVDETDIAPVAEIVKSPAKLKQLLFNEDGSYNIPNITDLLLSRQIKTNLAKHALLTGQTRQVQFYQSIHPYTTANELGLGGATPKNTEKGKVAKAGAVQRV